MRKLKESLAQILTWELKDAAWKEVEHLPLEQAIAERLKCAAEAIRAAGFENRVRDPRNRVVSESKKKESQA